MKLISRYKKIYLKSIVLGVGLLVTNVLCAQNDTEVYSEKVIVTSSYQPELQVHEKINTSPVITDTTKIKTNFKYSIYPNRIYSLFKPEVIKAARLVGEPTTKLYGSYFRLGMGTYMSPLADVYINSKRSETLNYTARVYHNSSWWSLEDYGDNHFSNTTVDLFGKRMWKDKVLSANLFYHNNYHLYYGFTDSTWSRVYPETERTDLKNSDYSQVYNYFGANVDFRKTTLTDKLYYYAAMDFTNLSDHYGSNELYFGAIGDIRYGFTLFGNDREHLGLKLSFDIYGNDKDTLYPYSFVGLADDSLLSFRTNILKVNPYIMFKMYGFDVNFGVNVVSSSDAEVLFFPRILLSQNFFDGLLCLKAGVFGDVYRNTWQSLRTENPYIAPGVDIENMVYSKFYLNADLSVANNLDIGLGLTYQTMENAPLFMIDTMYRLHNVYKPIYEDYSVFQIGANASYKFNEKFEFGFSANYYDYKLDTDAEIEKILYKPNYDLNIHTSYWYNDKIKVALNAVILGKMQGLNIDENGALAYEEMDMRYGIDLKAEYRHTNALSFFAMFDNVAFQRYFYWTNYPSQKFRFMVGLTYTLPTL
ncbi:MAG: hypothetical protein IKY43_03830 [Bacteroidales bacterium]|nr:hypothetical protein [Bacteroidales bacterium]